MYLNRPSPRSKKRKRSGKYDQKTNTLEDLDPEELAALAVDSSMDEATEALDERNFESLDFEGLELMDEMNSVVDLTDSESDTNSSWNEDSDDEYSHTSESEFSDNEDSMWDSTVPVENREDELPSSQPEDGNGQEVEASKEEVEGVSKRQKADKRKRDNVLKHWTEERDEYLREMMRHEASISVEEKCEICALTLDVEKESNSFKAVKCEDCIGYLPRCASCVVKSHICTPFHRVKLFNGYFWEKTTLRDLGLVLKMTHDGINCPEPAPAVDITVLDVNVIHKLSVSFCGCVKSYEKENGRKNQLLRHRMFPATSTLPKTAATFRLLKHFHKMTLQGKISAYDYYQSLVRLTDYTGSFTTKKRYDEFIRMIREYRHLKMLQRGGRGMQDSSTVGIKEGELALECPACPHPGINIAEGKEDEESWKDAQFLMVDANFRLKGKANRAKNDDELGPGWSYFVEEDKYKAHLKENVTVEEKEIRYCDSGLRAVDHANLKGSKIYEASGVVAVQCRHMFIRKNGVGDLQRGEKFGNVDYVLLSTMKAVKSKKIVLSYDINCQYHRNLKKRIDKYSSDIKLDLAQLDMIYVIPKFHLPGHGESCQTQFSLNFQRHVGRTDGENIERGWATLNPISMSMKEMGKGSRHDTLDDHFMNLNWEGTVSLGRQLRDGRKEATREWARHSKAHEEFSKAFPTSVIERIKKTIEEWYRTNGKSFDPFRDRRTTSTIEENKELLAEQEARERRRDQNGNEDIDDLTATQWLVVGLDLEDAQEKMREMFEALGSASTKAQRSLADDKNAQLLLRINAWVNAQRGFMPSIALPRDAEEDEAERRITRSSRRRIGLLPKASDIVLRLPSMLEKEVREKACTPDLIKKEIQLRVAQAEDALNDIRRTLRKRFTLNSRKIKHVVGTGNRGNTRMNISIDNVAITREELGRRYDRARLALLKLDPDGEWKKRLQVLSSDDMKPPMREDNGTGEGSYTPTWIWTMDGAASDKRPTLPLAVKDDSENSPNDSESETFDEGMCVDWARSFARVERWREEIDLVEEEMRRVIVFLQYKASKWLKKGGDCARNATSNDGRVEYANRQAHVMMSLAKKFSEQWSEVEDNM